MKESLRQTLRQKMQQRLSPLQMKLVRLLEMSTPEVEDEVRRELDDNPALEAESHDGGIAAEGGEEQDAFNESAEQMQLADYANEDEVPSYRLEAHNRSADDVHYEPMAEARGHSLMEQIAAQLAVTDMPEQTRRAALYIAGSLDDNGYMTRTIPELQSDMAILGFETDKQTLRDAVARIRALDPPGIGAYDLRDCLALQLRRLPRTPETELALEIVNHYFDLFSLRHFDRLKGAIGVSEEALRGAVEAIRGLNPKPAAGMGESAMDDRSRHIVPDFNVDADGDTLTLTVPNTLPELTIEESFRPEAEHRFGSGEGAREAEEFVSRKRDEATEFIELLQMRQQTLARVMGAIMQHQRDFFLTGDESRLRPMVLKDVANLIGMDISVVSRTAAGKYVATPSGTYPLKFFFSERAGAEEESSQREVLTALREVIEGEDPAHPLSDEALMQALAERGYEIARRTVTKYRERLGFPVARLRRKI